MAKLLVLGSGVLSAQVVDLLCTQSELYDDIVIASRDFDSAQRRTNLSRFAGIDMGRDQKLTIEPIDLRNIEQTAELIARHSPDVIFQGACIWSWWKIRELPQDIFAELDSVGVGPWLPLYLLLTQNVMKAVDLSAVRTLVVNACYPDATNAALASSGLAPLCGIGNLSRSIAILRVAFADVLSCPIADVAIRFYAHHYVGYQLLQTDSPAALPRILRVVHRGIDVTEHLAIDSIIGAIRARYPRVRGLAGQLITATSAFNVLRTLLHEGERIEHVPGPFGKVGGYPCLFKKGTLDSIVLENVNLAEAERVNEAGQTYEGIVNIDTDGTVTFREENMAVLKKHFGYSVLSMDVRETAYYADELLERYTRFAHNLARRPAF